MLQGGKRHTRKPETGRLGRRITRPYVAGRVPLLAVAVHGEGMRSASGSAEQPVLKPDMQTEFPR